MEVLAEHWALFLSLIHLAGWASAFHVLYTDRNPQATVGWALALLFLSPIAVPFYWAFGARRYKGYRRNLQRIMSEHEAQMKEIFDPLLRNAVVNREAFAGLRNLTPFPLTGNNSVHLYTRGADSFAQLFSELNNAMEYIVAEYFIIEDDELGNRFLDTLKRKAAEGVRVHVLYDLIGSFAIHRKHARQLRKAGVQIHRFGSPRFPASYLHINFRNHRKICVIDGKIGYVGGLNIGDKYVDKHPKLTPWGDAHLRIEGPGALMLQAVFLADWYSASNEAVPVRWDQIIDESNTREVAVIPTGPADSLHTCTLMILGMIREAYERIWITTPYLIPTEPIIAALESAASRGIDVRILVPPMPDHRVAFYAAWYFAERLRKAGIKIYRGEGFIHQKTMLIDQKLAAVGTVNLDSRSIELNFEVTALLTDPDSISEVERFIHQDLQRATDSEGEWSRLNWGQRTAARICRLFSPLL